MAKEQPPKRSIADLLGASTPQPEVRPLTDEQIEAATRKIHQDKQAPPPAPLARSRAKSTQADADDAITRISLDVTINMFMQMKEKALRNRQTMRNYLIELVERDLG